MRSLIIVALLAVAAFAQDPPRGWLSYATATCPPGTRITHFSGRWRVPSNPQPSNAFYSPWIGMDTTDNLNLLQPVNPWLGTHWVGYTEYFQWSPVNNVNSPEIPCKAGDMLYGTVVYNNDESYTITQLNTRTKQHSSQRVDVQKQSDGQHKNYTILYVVFEKVAECNQYPPDGKIVFEDLDVKCNYKTVKPQWKTAYVEDVCNFRAHIIDPETISMTWDTKAANPPMEKLEAQRARNVAEMLKRRNNKGGSLQVPAKKAQP